MGCLMRQWPAASHSLTLLRCVEHRNRIYGGSGRPASPRWALRAGCHDALPLSHPGVWRLVPALGLQVYGYQGIKEGQSSEHLVGRFASQAGADKPLVLGTKFFTVPWTNVLVRSIYPFQAAAVWKCCHKCRDVPCGCLAACHKPQCSRTALPCKC